MRINDLALVQVPLQKHVLNEESSLIYISLCACEREREGGRKERERGEARERERERGRKERERGGKRERERERGGKRERERGSEKEKQNDYKMTPLLN